MFLTGFDMLLIPFVSLLYVTRQLISTLYSLYSHFSFISIICISCFSLYSLF